MEGRIGRLVISACTAQRVQSRGLVQLASGRGLMFEGHVPEAPDQRNAEHDLWLAMQAAYNKYMETSAALDVAVSELQRAIPSGEGRLGIETAASENRTAFENYIEARMQFAEFRCDRNNAGRRSSADPNAEEDCTGRKPVCGSWSGSKIPRLALQAAMVALLCTTAFSLAYAVRERSQIRDSDAERDQISAMLSQTHDDIQAVVRKLNGVNVTQKFAVRESDGVPAKPVSPRRVPVAQAAERKPAVNVRWRRIQTPYVAPPKRSNVVATNEKLAHQVRNPGGSTSWGFTLRVSKRFQSVGPLRLSVRLVSPKYGYVDLCVMTDDFKLKHVNLHEPVRLTLSNPSLRLELVVTRIDKT